VKLLILDENLMWSAKLQKSATALGWAAIVLDELGDEVPSVDAAILNLSSRKYETEETVARLHAKGIFTIAHAGHVEKENLEKGRQAGCGIVTTNGATANKLDEILAKAERLINSSESD
jgi:hypothetical protein